MSRLRKAWSVTVKGGCGMAEIVYAPSAGRARMDTFRTLSDVWSEVRVVDIVVRRAAERDVRLPDRDPIADQLSDAERNCLLHAFGADQGDPTKAGYRDYFYTRRDDPPLVALTDRSLMAPMSGDKWGKDMTYFVLTSEGKRVAESLLPEYRP